MEKEFKAHLAEVTKRVQEAGSVVPLNRAVHKKGFTFSRAAFEDELPVWNYIWKNGGYWQKLQAFFFLERYVNKKECHKSIWTTSSSWQEEVYDWSLCDALAKLNTKVLETYPDEVYQQLTLWNKSDDLWKRRQSLVSLLYFSRTKKTYLPFEKISGLIVPLLPDKEYYVQKAVGWALRELHTVYPEQAALFLKAHIKNVSPIAFTIAIEKMDVAQKNLIKTLRANK